MTFLEAAIEVLVQNKNQPMASREIWDKISELNLVNTLGKTPWASLNTILLHHSKIEYKKTIYFDISSENPMKFSLSNLNNIHLGVEISEIPKEDEINIKTPLYSITSKELEWKKLSIFNCNENIEYEVSDCDEFTYVIEDNAHATIKIGKTKNDPEIRFNQLKTANPSIKLLHVFPSCQWSENELHNKFYDFQKDLEWFFFTKGLKNFLFDEMNKHEKIINSYKKKKELETSEKYMIDII
jgi:hypothetical protein